MAGKEDKMRKRNKSIVTALVTISVVAGTFIPTTPAQAAVKCGDNITTYRTRPPVVQTLQRLTYINCTGRTLRRKADNAWIADGKCMRIGPWQTVSLARGVLKRFPVHIRGSKPC